MISTTFQASPVRLMVRMIQPDGSSAASQRLSPENAERAKAWWLWCQASPSDGSASQVTLVE